MNTINVTLIGSPLLQIELAIIGVLMGIKLLTWLRDLILG